MDDATTDTVSTPDTNEIDHFVRGHIEDLRNVVAWFEEGYEKSKAKEQATLRYVYGRIVGFKERSLPGGVSNRKHPRRKINIYDPDQKSYPNTDEWRLEDVQRASAMLLLDWLIRVDTASIKLVGGPAFNPAVKGEIITVNSRAMARAKLLSYSNWAAWLSWAWENRHRLTADVYMKPGSDFLNFAWGMQRFEFKKGRQAQAVRVLWEAWENGRSSLTQETIADAAGSDATNFRVADVFRGHPALNTLIISPSKGVFRLAPPKEIS